jgi:hypothetical protein
MTREQHLRMVKKAAVSPTQPRHAKTCLSVTATAKKHPQAYPLGTLRIVSKENEAWECLGAPGLGGCHSAFFNILLEGGQADGYYR